MHDKFHYLLQQYIDGDLEPLETIVIEEHLSACQSCRRMLNQLKLMDWDLKHQPVVEPPPELEAHRQAAVKIHLSNVKAAESREPVKETWRLQKQILKHTFAFVSYNPVNQRVAGSAKKTFLVITRAAGKSLKKGNPILTKLIPGQA